MGEEEKGDEEIHFYNILDGFSSDLKVIIDPIVIM